MVPRSFWDDDPRFLLGTYTDGGLERYTDDHRQGLRQLFAKSSFCPNRHFVCVWMIKDRGDEGSTLIGNNIFSTHYTFEVRGVEIVEALTAATKAEDLADAFAWIEDKFPSHMAQQVLQVMRTRSALYYGSPTPHDSMPVPSRGFNNEVACMIMRRLCLDFEIRLTGLRGAAHLNGKRGVIRGQFPANSERWIVLLDDGLRVSVKANNFVHVPSGDYKCTYGTSDVSAAGGIPWMDATTT
jgi:hypothetical protein